LGLQCQFREAGLKTAAERGHEKNIQILADSNANVELGKNMERQLDKSIIS
jgi:hypothetical protein